jgi:RiboL-PSP-HEPN
MRGRAEVTRLRKRLDNVFARVPSAQTDIELQSDFSRYLCVLVSGFFENAIVALVVDFTQRKSALEVAAFVESRLEYWTNPNTEKICSLLGSFNSDWRKEAEAYLIDERKESVNSLVALRHKIAHGESVGTSLSQVKAYYQTILQVVDFIADTLERRPRNISG